MMDTNSEAMETVLGIDPQREGRQLSVFDASFLALYST